MNYIEVAVKVEPKLEGSDVLIATLSELAFESFVETETGFNAYITEDEFSEEVDENSETEIDKDRDLDLPEDIDEDAVNEEDLDMEDFTDDDFSDTDGSNSENSEVITKEGNTEDKELKEMEDWLNDDEDNKK